MSFPDMALICKYRSRIDKFLRFQNWRNNAAQLTIVTADSGGITGLHFLSSSIHKGRLMSRRGSKELIILIAFLIKTQILAQTSKEKLC